MPPKIDEEFSSSEVTVREGSSVALRCRATGNPKPDIRWKRDHDLKIHTSPDDGGKHEDIFTRPFTGEYKTVLGGSNY